MSNEIHAEESKFSSFLGIIPSWSVRLPGVFLDSSNKSGALSGDSCNHGLRLILRSKPSQFTFSSQGWTGKSRLETLISQPSSSMRRNQLLFLIAICALVFGTLSLLRRPAQIPVVNTSKTPEVTTIPASDHTSHPIHQLITKAEHDFTTLESRQSKTLSEAVKEYRRRYRISPPPNFDQWFRLAQDRNVRLIDEYDTIYHALLPFWALDPSLIRKRAREALGFDNAFLGVLIRDGAVVTAAGEANGSKSPLRTCWRTLSSTYPTWIYPSMCMMSPG